MVATHKADGTIFDLLKDGAAHTLYFFFWVNQANNAVISLVQLWEGVGAVGPGSRFDIIELTHAGSFWVTIQVLEIDGTNASWRLCPEGGGWGISVYPTPADTGGSVYPYNYSSSATKVFVQVDISDNTDLYTFRQIHFILRSER